MPLLPTDAYRGPDPASHPNTLAGREAFRLEWIESGRPPLTWLDPWEAVHGEPWKEGAPSPDEISEEHEAYLLAKAARAGSQARLSTGALATNTKMLLNDGTILTLGAVGILALAGLWRGRAG